jgi:hypothetical protein
MATFYNTSYAEVPATEVQLLQSISDSTIVLSILVTNRNGGAAADITLSHKNSSDAIQNYVAFTIAIPADSNVDLIGNKYILPSGDKFFLSSSTSGLLDVAVSYVEV